MDKNHNPGICFEGIDLLSCRVDRINPDHELRYHLSLIDLKRSVSEDGNRLGVVLQFNLMAGVEKPPFEFECTFASRYSREEASSMTWEEFTDIMILAHAIPFVREFIANITNRLPIPALVLAPINTHLLLAESQERSAPPSAAPSTATT